MELLLAEGWIWDENVDALIDQLRVLSGFVPDPALAQHLLDELYQGAGPSVTETSASFEVQGSDTPISEVDDPLVPALVMRVDLTWPVGTSTILCRFVASRRAPDVAVALRLLLGVLFSYRLEGDWTPPALLPDEQRPRHQRTG